MKKLPKVSVNKLIKNLLYKNKNEIIFCYGNKKISRLELLNKCVYLISKSGDPTDNLISSECTN